VVQTIQNETASEEGTMSAKKAPQKSPKKRTEKTEIWTAEEKAAMKEHAREMKARRGKEDDEATVLAKIDEMPEPDRSLGKRVHEIVMASAPSLAPRLWYGMPAYSKDGKVLCYFQNAAKFKSRYSTFGFNDTANLDKGAMWPTSFAITELTSTEESKIRTLVKKAAS
jgi:uncharacterized protein YdhG (YjbR/CyaY superfamily)